MVVPVVNVSSQRDRGNDDWTREKERERENTDTKINTREGEDSEEIEPVLFFVAYEIKEKIRKGDKEDKEGKKSRGKERMLTTQDAYNTYAHSELFYDKPVNFSLTSGLY